MSLDVYLECECCDSTVYENNITHNLGEMAKDAEIYKHLWSPDELNIERAEELIEPLEKGLDLLRSDPERFKEFNPSNGWGDYEGLVRFVDSYLYACKRFPKLTVRVWK